MTYLTLVTWATIALLAAASPARAGDGPGDPVVGRKLAEAWCTNCHVVGEGGGPATATGAPSFRSIAETRGLTALSLKVFLSTSHERMPDLHLGQEEADDLIAYIFSTRGH